MCQQQQLWSRTKKSFGICEGIKKKKRNVVRGGCRGLSVHSDRFQIYYHIFHNLSRLVALNLLLRLLICMIEDLSKNRCDLFISRALRYIDDEDEAVFFLDLHVLLEVEFELDVVVDVDVDEVELDEDEEDEDEDELVPDTSARTGTGAFGAGVGIET